MVNLKETALAYESEQRMKNIAELPEVSLADVNVQEKTVNKSDGSVLFTAKYIVVGNQEYRIPKTVLSSLKVFLEDNPKLKTFKVKRTGTTKDDTVYTVIPLKSD